MSQGRGGESRAESVNVFMHTRCAQRLSQLYRAYLQAALIRYPKQARDALCLGAN